MSEEDNLKRIQEETKGKHGGARPGSGRPKGSTNKITAGEFLETYRKAHENSFEEDYVLDMRAARERGDMETVYKLQQAMLKYVISDIQQIDHTSLGESMRPNFQFPSRELPDWSNIPITITTKDE